MKVCGGRTKEAMGTSPGAQGVGAKLLLLAYSLAWLKGPPSLTEG